MKPMPRSAMQVSPQRAAIRAEQGSQGLKKFDQANYQNRQATMQQPQQGMGQPFLDPDQLTRQGIRRFEGNAALKQYDQQLYKEKQNPTSMSFAVQPYPGMPANFVGGLGSGIAAGLTTQNQSYGGFAGGIYNTANQIDDRKNFISGAVPGLGGQAYAGGNPNFDERSGQFNNLIRYNDPRSAQGPDRMGMPQAYPDRIADPMRPQEDRGPLTRVSPGVYRNTQGQLTGPGGRVMPNQPNRNPAQDNAADMWNNMQPQNPQGNMSNLFNDLRSQNPKGPQGTLPYGGQQPQNPIYGSFGNRFDLPQNTNVMPGYAGPRQSFSPFINTPPGQYLNRGR